MTMDSLNFSIVLPAFNEAKIIGSVVMELKKAHPHAEILVIDDGSTDDTSHQAEQSGAKVVRHPYNMGNGAAIKTGARHAKEALVVFMDADGQHSATDIHRLLAPLTLGYTMSVGARLPSSQASLARRLGNNALNQFASLLTGRPIPDLTSGFRAVRTDLFRNILYLLPNGFSYPTTSTMAFLRSGYPIIFIPIEAKKRIGKSKINLTTDGARFFLVILKVITLYAPMRVFLPASLVLFLLGLGRYIYVYLESGHFTNMPAILFSGSLLTFLMGLISEQITTLHLSHSQPGYDPSHPKLFPSDERPTLTSVKES
ncbi:MAG: glycosyltransferase family 2 protein [Magnetococcus sp. DMHC-6]